MSNYTCPQLQEETFASVPFAEVPEGCCRPIHVQPFTADLHLFGFECNNQGWVFGGILLLTVFIKLLQNFLGTWVGQLERELMQLKPDERKCFQGEYGACGSRKTCFYIPNPRCCGKLGYLIWLEIVGGVIGILSILVITGNNFWIWFILIFSNSLGVFLAVWKANPDHHSPASELLNVVANAETYQDEKDPEKRTKEGKRSHDALLQLKSFLDDITEVQANDIIQKSDTIRLRKRLVL